MLDKDASLANNNTGGNSPLEAICMIRLSILNEGGESNQGADKNKIITNEGFKESLKILYNFGAQTNNQLYDRYDKNKEYGQSAKDSIFFLAKIPSNPNGSSSELEEVNERLKNIEQELRKNDTSFLKESISKGFEDIKNNITNNELPPLEKSIRGADMSECKNALDQSYEVKQYHKNLESKSKKGSVGAGAFALISTAILSSLAIKDLPSTRGAAAFDGLAIGAIALSSYATIWGVGRLGYE